jgi:large subunit ribosomal protein L9
MKVILKKEHEKLGNAGETVNVKDGYAMNYLIPQGVAVKATSGNMKVVEEIKKQRANKLKKESSDTEHLAGELEKVQVTVKVKAGEDDKIYGSVTSQMIADALSEKGFNVDKKFIELEESIKHLGVFNVNLKFNNNVGTSLKVWVVKE